MSSRGAQQALVPGRMVITLNHHAERNPVAESQTRQHGFLIVGGCDEQQGGSAGLGSRPNGHHPQSAQWLARAGGSLWQSCCSSQHRHIIWTWQQEQWLWWLAAEQLLFFFSCSSFR